MSLPNAPAVEPVAPTTPAPAQNLVDAIGALSAKQAEMLETIKSLSKPAVPGARENGPLLPVGVRTGEDPLSSRGFSFQRLAGFLGKQVDKDQCKVEFDMHERLRKLYVERGYEKAMQNSILCPVGAELIAVNLGEENFATEVRQVMAAGIAGANPEEVRRLRQQHWGVQKALSWQDNVNLGSTVAPPAFGELIEVLRNNEVLMAAGCRVIPMPPQGRITFPRQTGAATAYWVGESALFTEAAPTTGDVTLQAHKLGVLVKIPNELFRFSSISVEQFIREDVARVMSLKLDKTLLENAGSATTPKGLINYAGINTYVSAGVATNGDVFSPEDVANMVGTVESQNAIFKAFIMRPLMWSAIVNRRADAVSVGDAKGQFLFNVLRELGTQFELGRQTPGNLYGYPVLKSTQIAKDHAKGSGTTLTYVLGGDFNDYMIAMSGVMEFQMSTQGDTPFTYDQTWMRGTLYCDGAPRHEASFCYCNSLLEA